MRLELRSATAGRACPSRHGARCQHGHHGALPGTDRRFQHELTKRSGWPPRPPAQTLRWRTSRLGGTDSPARGNSSYCSWT